MSATLSAIPVRQRRRLVTVLGLFAALLLAIGALTVSDAPSAGLVAIAVVAFAVGALLALMAWGVAASVRREGADRQLDSAVQAALAAHGTTVTCGCGHEHDPDEMQVVDEPAVDEPVAHDCGHDGAGVACTHDCTTCVLAGLRR